MNQNAPPSMPELYGEVLINYTNHDGLFMIGLPPFEFMTKWSSAGSDSVHTYNDHPTVRSVGIAENASEIHEVNQSHFDLTDFSSRSRTPHVGQIVLMENAEGFKAAIKIIQVSKHKTLASKSFLQFRFAITQDRGADFSPFTEQMFANKGLLDTVWERSSQELHEPTPNTKPTPSDTFELEPSEQLDVSEDLDTVSDSVDWTGGRSIRQCAVLVRNLAPSAMAATQQLIDQYEAKLHNGGPPLDDHEDILESLKKLHAALGQLIRCASDESKIDQLPGLIGEAISWAGRVKDDVTGDPMPLAIATLIGAICITFDLAATGGLASAAALTYGRKSKSEL